MKKLTIKRSQEYFNRWYPYQILINGNWATEIGSGETKELMVPPNAKVSAKLSIVGSKELALLEDQKDNWTLEVKANDRLHRYLIIIGLLFFPLMWLVDSLWDGLAVKIGLTAMAVLLIFSLIALLFIGKKNWLLVRKVD